MGCNHCFRQQNAQIDNETSCLNVIETHFHDIKFVQCLLTKTLSGPGAVPAEGQRAGPMNGFSTLFLLRVLKHFSYLELIYAAPGLV